MCILFHTGNTVVVRLGSLTVAATHHGEVMYVADRHLLLGTSVVVLYQKRCDEYYALYPNQRQEFGHPCTDVRVNQSLGFECVKGYTITIIVKNSSWPAWLPVSSEPVQGGSVREQEHQRELSSGQENPSRLRETMFRS